MTKSITSKDHLICFKKNSLGFNCPNKDLCMTTDHKINYNNQWVAAEKMLSLKDVVKKKIRKELNEHYVYNILMKKHTFIIAQNMKCETLHPNNKIAKIFKKRNIKNKEEKIKLMNECITKYMKILKSM